MWARHKTAHFVTQSTLLAVIESILLIFFNNLSPEKFDLDSPGGQALLALVNLGFFFDISATFSALLLISEFGKIQVQTPDRDLALQPRDYMVRFKDQDELLKRYGVRGTLRLVMWHCKHYPPCLWATRTHLPLCPQGS
jgi:hypothetical protein